MKLRDLLLVGCVGVGCVEEGVVKKTAIKPQLDGVTVYRQSLDKLLMVERGWSFNYDVLKECENQVASELVNSNSVLKVSNFLSFLGGNCLGRKDSLECEKYLVEEIMLPSSRDEYFRTKAMVVNKLSSCLEKVGRESYAIWYSFPNLSDSEYFNFVLGNKPTFVLFLSNDSDESKVRFWRYFKDFKKEDFKKVKIGKVLALENYDFYNKNVVGILDDGRSVEVEGLIFVNGKISNFVLKGETMKFKKFLENDFCNGKE